VSSQPLSELAPEKLSATKFFFLVTGGQEHFFKNGVEHDWTSGQN